MRAMRPLLLVSVLLAAGVANAQSYPAQLIGACRLDGGAGCSPFSTPLSVANGGTGNSSATAYSVVLTGTTSTGAFKLDLGPGTSGYALISNGAGAYPTWQTIVPVPPGSSGQVIYNSAGAYAATANLLIGSGVVYAADSTVTLGDSTRRWKEIWAGGTAASVPLTARLHASQTANALEIQNSAGTVLASISATGGLTVPASAGVTIGAGTLTDIGGGTIATVGQFQAGGTAYIYGNVNIINGANGAVRWYSGSAYDLAITRKATNTLQFGFADDTAAEAQTITFQGVSTGSDVAGANATLIGSLGRGSAASGTLIFQTGTPQASGSTAHVAATVLTLSNIGTGGTAQPVAAFSGVARLKGYTVATLPAGAVVGDLAYVTDATAPTYNAALTGGGAVVVPVFYNGAAWTSH